MSQKQKIKKQIRRAHERAAALIVAVGILLGVVAVSHEARRLITQLAMRPVFAVVEHSSKESETAHRPVRLENVLPTSPLASGGDI